MIRSRSPKSPGETNLRLHVDRMTEQQLEQAIETINKDPTTITIVDNNGNENQIKTDITEIPNTNERTIIKITSLLVEQTLLKITIDRGNGGAKEKPDDIVITDATAVKTQIGVNAQKKLAIYHQPLNTRANLL